LACSGHCRANSGSLSHDRTCSLHDCPAKATSEPVQATNEPIQATTGPALAITALVQAMARPVQATSVSERRKLRTESMTGSQSWRRREKTKVCKIEQPLFRFHLLRPLLILCRPLLRLFRPLLGPVQVAIWLVPVTASPVQVTAPGNHLAYSDHCWACSGHHLNQYRSPLNLLKPLGLIRSPRGLFRPLDELRPPVGL
jgi:hypothetical protein